MHHKQLKHFILAWMRGYYSRRQISPQLKLGLIEDEGSAIEKQKTDEKSTQQLKNPYSSKYICVKHFPPPYKR